MTRKEKLIYLAGIVDGEGHFYLPNIKPGGRNKAYPTPCLVVANNDLNLLNWIMDNFGGYINTSKGRACSQWRLYHSKAVKLTKELIPYLIVKTHQAQPLVDL